MSHAAGVRQEARAVWLQFEVHDRFDNNDDSSIRPRYWCTCKACLLHLVNLTPLILFAQMIAAPSAIMIIWKACHHDHLKSMPSSEAHAIIWRARHHDHLKSTSPSEAHAIIWSARHHLKSTPSSEEHYYLKCTPPSEEHAPAEVHATIWRLHHHLKSTPSIIWRARHHLKSEPSCEEQAIIRRASHRVKSKPSCAEHVTITITIWRARHYLKSTSSSGEHAMDHLKSMPSSEEHYYLKSTPSSEEYAIISWAPYLESTASSEEHVDICDICFVSILLFCLLVSIDTNTPHENPLPQSTVQSRFYDICDLIRFTI